LPGANTLAYFASSFGKKKKKPFIALTPVRRGLSLHWRNPSWTSGTVAEHWPGEPGRTDRNLLVSGQFVTDAADWYGRVLASRKLSMLRLICTGWARSQYQEGSTLTCKH